MTMLAERQEAQALSLADYEARIHIYREQIGTGYIGIGRTLNEAKAAGVVPHGQWEAWVERTTGLSARNAQRCMQAANEIRDGSQLARLEMSKALLLLGAGLAEEEQEEMARKAADEGTSLRALQDEVKRLKLQVVESTGAAVEIKDKLKAAEAERDQVAAQARANFRQFQERLDDETGKAYRRGKDESRAEVVLEVRKEFQGKLEFMTNQRDQAEAARKDALDALTAERLSSGKRWDEGFAAGQGEIELRDKKIKELEKEKAHLIDDLKRAGEPADYQQLKRNQADLLAAAEEAEKRAADAEAELAAMRSGAEAKGEPAVRRLRMAVNDFLLAVESIEWTPADIQRAKPLMRVSIEDVEAWSERMWDLLKQHPVTGEGVVE